MRCRAKGNIKVTERTERENAFGDAVYDAWMAGMNPDHVDRDRVYEDVDGGCDRLQAAERELDRLRHSRCEHEWIEDYMGDPDVPGGQMFFGVCCKCGASSDSP